MSWPQQRLALWAQPSLAREDFIVTASNAEAAARVDAWPDWPGGALALVGPAASGKTHLASAWARRTGAAVHPSRARPGAAVLVEEADRRTDDEALFHLLESAETRSGVLLTAQRAPRDWPNRLPDLRSRLAALAVAELKAPDDALLEQVFARLFAAVGLRPAPDVVPYLLTRMARSLAEARDLVAALDGETAALGRPLTRALAREVLEERGGSGELFE